MPAYHSSFVDSEYRTIGNLAVLPLKTKSRGPAPAQADPNADDIIDEAFNLYRANCLFRNFEVKGSCDRVLIYLTIFIGECLSKLALKTPTPGLQDALKLLNTHALQSFSLPGDPSFPVNAFIARPSNSAEADNMKAYLGQLRQEVAIRLPQRIYEGDKPSKWWLAFSKRKFMNITKVRLYIFLIWTKRHVDTSL
ncbi:putative ARC18-subunit of the Arp2/3 complex [Gonapodya prolifera JEL478]|uniref:Actin-related protein 2/3 complex subunit 3 n=1 Tax=Gonapodya prolifera (strain JEL478) TaxID=1344416 RepID=A0A139AVZ9_GONPJ|nr:putative ARC18-subunit of the Arp2/3 complex [Gonapodya prolifera JEL478]|eukprot:KXS20874.1 putative ARC18-subunit of the Arp2/3 complex [Gonapodya prolifera JEL478]